MDSHSEADAPQLTQIQKVNACLHSLINKVSLLFLISRLRGWTGLSESYRFSLTHMHWQGQLPHSPGQGGNVRAGELVAAMGELRGVELWLTNPQGGGRCRADSLF